MLSLKDMKLPFLFLLILMSAFSIKVTASQLEEAILQKVFQDHNQEKINGSFISHKSTNNKQNNRVNISNERSQSLDTKSNFIKLIEIRNFNNKMHLAQKQKNCRRAGVSVFCAPFRIRT